MKAFRRKNQKEMPEWIRTRVAEIIQHTTRGTSSRTPQTPDPDDLVSHPSDDDYPNDRRTHKDNILSHSTSAPNIGNYRSRQGEESSDESRSTSQQDSRPPSSRDQDGRSRGIDESNRQMQMQLNGPTHPMYNALHNQQRNAANSVQQQQTQQQNPQQAQQQQQAQQSQQAQQAQQQQAQQQQAQQQQAQQHQQMMMVQNQQISTAFQQAQAQAEAERHKMSQMSQHAADQS